MSRPWSIPHRWWRLVLFAAPLVAVTPVLAQEEPAEDAQPPVVRAVLFFHPTCPHCHELMTNTLPPIQERFGERLQIVAVSTATPQGQELYRAAYVQYGMTESGVPMMVVGERVLLGGIQIPALLPGLVEEGLAAGGIDWPPLPGLRALVATAMTERGGGGEAAGGDPVGAIPADLSPMDRFRLDPAGNGLSVAVLMVMVAILLWVGASFVVARVSLPPVPAWVVPVLALAGLGVASYLSFVEVTGSEAVCGPVGDCNTVQQSPYAHLFGIVPVGLLGVGGYLAMIGAWGVAANGPGGLRDTGRWLLLGMAAFGTVLSAYLTFLEPFVIGATCMWCLSSAVIVTAILMVSASPRLRPGGAPAT